MSNLFSRLSSRLFFDSVNPRMWQLIGLFIYLAVCRSVLPLRGSCPPGGHRQRLCFPQPQIQPTKEQQEHGILQGQTHTERGNRRRVVRGHVFPIVFSRFSHLSVRATTSFFLAFASWKIKEPDLHFLFTMADTCTCY